MKRIFRAEICAVTSDAEAGLRIELMGRSRGIVIIPMRDLDMARHPSLANFEMPHVGFGTQTSSGIDFVSAPVVVGMSGAAVPDWHGELIVRLQGKVWRRSDFRSVKILDFIFLRKFVADTERGPLALWYFPAFVDSIFPADPMFPWGGDFYKFLRHLLGYDL